MLSAGAVRSSAKTPPVSTTFICRPGVSETVEPAPAPAMTPSAVTSRVVMLAAEVTANFPPVSKVMFDAVARLAVMSPPVARKITVPAVTVDAPPVTRSMPPGAVMVVAPPEVSAGAVDGSKAPVAVILSAPLVLVMLPVAKVVPVTVTPLTPESTPVVRPVPLTVSRRAAVRLPVLMVVPVATTSAAEMTEAASVPEPAATLAVAV